MSALKVGDICVLQKLVHQTEFNGMKVIIESAPYKGFYVIDIPGFEQWKSAHRRNLRKIDPPADDDAASRQDMLDCIERAQQPAEVAA